MKVGIKICGLVRREDVVAACALGVDAIGFVFYRPSSRFLEIDQAAELRSAIAAGVTCVGLFVNASREEVLRTAEQVRLDVLQFHGDESAEHCKDLASACGLPWWRAVRMAGPNDMSRAAAHYPEAQALLLDAHVQGYGGSGQAFDWSWIPETRPAQHPMIIMSGGLTPETVSLAITRTRPWMVDVSSGVQGDSARRKDLVKMERFVTAVRTTYL